MAWINSYCKQLPGRTRQPFKFIENKTNRSKQSKLYHRKFISCIRKRLIYVPSTLRSDTYHWMYYTIICFSPIGAIYLIKPMARADSLQCIHPVRGIDVCFGRLVAALWRPSCCCEQNLTLDWCTCKLTRCVYVRRRKANTEIWTNSLICVWVVGREWAEIRHKCMRPTCVTSLCRNFYSMTCVA